MPPSEATSSWPKTWRRFDEWFIRQLRMFHCRSQLRLGVVRILW